MTLKAFKAIKALLLTAGLLGAAVSQAAIVFANGADVGWVSQQEAAGYRWYTAEGARTDPFYLLRTRKQINSIRLRVWVNPADGWNNGADVLYKAKRAQAEGQRIMIDFHYSDGWADPGQQTKPAAWANHTISQLYTDVYDHTRGILSYLKNNGVNVEWVQVGNEINGGMLWPQGSTANFSQLAGLINSGYNAAKSIYPSAAVIVHLANGYKGAEFQSFFDRLRNAGGKFDVIGLSHYPPAADWQNYNNMIANTMNNMVARYNKPVMITEVGMDWQQAATANQMMNDLILKTKWLGDKGLGIFWWEPQSYPGWQGYTMGATDASGKLTIALDPF